MFFIKGIGYGIMLSFMIGPIFFALLQAGIEKGLKTAISLASGIWLSDFLYILVAYFGLSWIKNVSQLPNFGLFVGAVGGVVLMSFGVAMVLNSEPVDKSKRINQSSYLAYFIKGFLINTVNPFTILFWIAMSSEIFTNQTNGEQAIAFFGGIYSMIIATDILKMLLSKQISKYLKHRHIFVLRKIVGVILFIGGLVLIYRTAF